MNKCPNCGNKLSWSIPEMCEGKTCKFCNKYIPPRLSNTKYINGDDVPTAFIANSDYQPEGVPVKIVNVSRFS